MSIARLTGREADNRASYIEVSRISVQYPYPLKAGGSGPFLLFTS